MKVLYVKSNSERSKEFQLQTIIYKENGQRFVKKVALNEKAIHHLKKIKDNYEKLKKSIINPKVKLAKIVDESGNSLTFEFIDGVSLERKYIEAKREDENEALKIIEDYKSFLKNSFKTTKFDSTTMVNDKFVELFGENDYSQLDGELCFDGISNIDLIFSNIIYKDDYIYIIDYEWVFELNIPISYMLYRNLYTQTHKDILYKMEENYIKNYVVKNGFFFYQHYYLKNKYDVFHLLEEKDKQIHYLQNLAESMRIKNRIKRIIKKVIPTKFLNKLLYAKFIVSIIILKTFEKIKLLADFPKKHDNNIVKMMNVKKKSNDIICVFAHYDKDGLVDDYVFYYLDHLNSYGMDIVFVSTATNLSQDSINSLKKYCRDIIVKENIGYDFGAWATGITYLGDEINDYKTLILCNDSVYFPLFPIKEMFDKMSNKFDFWGMTDSYEVHYHIQSYFMVFNKKVFTSEVFKNIWRNYKVYKLKRNIILKYEIGLSKKLMKHNFKIGAYCPYKNLNVSKKVNPTHFFWKTLIKNYRCPSLKIELLRDNPSNVDISDWKRIVSIYTDYNIDLIINHLNRVKNKQKKIK